MKKISFFFSALILFVLNSCTGLGLVVANAPSHFFNGKIVKNIPYGDKDLQNLDIYTPSLKKSKEQKLPVIVFLHGGRWTDGDSSQYKFVGTALAEKGYVVVIPNYRKYPDIRFPDFVWDAAQATQWVHENIGVYNGDNDHLFIMGHSSGAHVGSLLVSNQKYLNESGDSFNAIKGFAGLAGPYAFTPDEPDLIDMFRGTESYHEMQSPTFIDGDEPPMFLLHGLQDDVVGLLNIERLQHAIKAKKGRVTVKTYPNLDHISIIGSLSWVLRSKASVLNDIDAFFKSQTTDTKKPIK